MGNKVPQNVAKEIKDIVFKEADNCNYLSKSRTANAQFLTQLVGMPTVGGRLSDFIQKSEVRTYIKDAILNRYAKDKSQQKKPNDLSVIIKNTVGVQNVQLLESDPLYQVDLYNSFTNKFIVVAAGTFLKWETALRKALLYIASKPFAQNSKNEVIILLALFARNQKIGQSDAAHLAKALSICNGHIYIYGEI